MMKAYNGARSHALNHSGAHYVQLLEQTLNRIKYCLTSEAFVVVLFPPRDQQTTICI